MRVAYAFGKIAVTRPLSRRTGRGGRARKSITIGMGQKGVRSDHLKILPLGIGDG
jgi:hypothetical protein